MTNDPKAEQKIKEWSSQKGLKANFESRWQSLHDYFYIEADDITRMQSPGSELNSQVLFDATTLEAADVLASGFMNYLTPPTSKWFALRPRNPIYKGNVLVSTYYENIADEVNYTLNRSNYYTEMFSLYKGSGVYGTSVLLEEEDVDDDVRFYCIPINQVTLVEDGRGRVTGYYIEFEYTVDQAADKWGEEKLSKDMKDELKSDAPKTKKHKFLLYISKRHVRDVRKTDKKNLPIEACWIDVEGKTVIDESGYHEMPIMSHRFDKRSFTPWGYSPAMKAIIFARTLNAMAKTTLRATMKGTDPAVAVPENAFLMPFNQNPRAVNYYKSSKMPNGKNDIFTLGNSGDPSLGLNMVEYYSQKVRQLMFNDVFLAFDNITKQMNNPEVQERINEKMTLLGPAVGRYIGDINQPTIIRTIGILSRLGRLPEPPEELLQDPNYEIDCISQLAQAQRRSELGALLSGLQLAGQISTFKPDVLDKISGDKTLDEAFSILGAPTRIFNDDAEVEAIREAKGRAAMAQQQMEMANIGADTIKKGSEADKNVALSQAARAQQ